MLSSSRDNWERLVAAVIKKQQLWEMFHSHSRSPSISSLDSDVSSILDTYEPHLPETVSQSASVDVTISSSRVFRMSSAAPTVGYNFIKDLTLFLRSRERHIEVLRDSLALLLTNLITIKSRKRQIDEFFKSPTTKMPTGEYKILEKNIEKTDQRTKDFIGKYKKFVKDIDLNSLIASLDDSAAVRLPDVLERTKPSMKAKNIFKLARLDIDVMRLNCVATMVIERLKSENLITDKESKDRS